VQGDTSVFNGLAPHLNHPGLVATMEQWDDAVLENRGSTLKREQKYLPLPQSQSPRNTKQTSESALSPNRYLQDSHCRYDLCKALTDKRKEV
jgi:hypothetical protein